MRKIILALTALSLSTTAFAMGTVPAAVQAEAEAEKVVPAAELEKVRLAVNDITQARLANVSTADERKATAAFATKAINAMSAAGKARLALDRAGFDRNAAIVLANRDKACAVLSGC